MDNKQITEQTTEILKGLLELLEVTTEPEISVTSSNDEVVVSITIAESEQSGLLIGTRGSTLQAIQSFVALALKQKTGEWCRVVLDIGDWRTKHEDYLKNLAAQAAERARTTGQDQHLYNLSPSQRRTIHMYLAEESGVKTESQGEGTARYLIVKAA